MGWGWNFAVGASIRLHATNDRVDHGGDSRTSAHTAFAHKRAPGEVAQRQVQHGALLCAQFRPKHIVVSRELRAETQFADFPDQWMMFNIAQDAGEQVSVALIPFINGGKTFAKSLSRAGDGAPRRSVGHRITL